MDVFVCILLSFHICHKHIILIPLCPHRIYIYYNYDKKKVIITADTGHNAMTGEIVCSKSITGVADQINTSGWKSGVYVINAVVGKKKFSKKIVIK